jgi:spermidine/putrescine transport system permease protein
MRKGTHGGVVWEPSLERTADAQLELRRLFVRTLAVTLVSTALSIAIALPCGYAMARSRAQTLLLFLVIIPFWTNSLIRINAWIAILGNEGFLNETLRRFGLITESLPFLYNQRAVVLVLVYMYLPYAILPIFTAMDKFDFSLLEAARDLGATKSQSMLKVLLPNVRAGIVTAIIFTFIPIFGAYTVPLLVGGRIPTCSGTSSSTR